MNLPIDNNFILFIIFFIPGFISVKIYDLIMLVEKRDFSKSISEVIGYSCLNYGALSWLIIFIHKSQYFINHLTIYYLMVVLILFIIPILWPILFLKIIKSKPLSKYINNPTPKPWDFVFLKREPYWIIIHLKNGLRIGGVYNTNSYASLYPIEEQIYLQEVWKLDKSGKFIEPIKRSRGIIIMREDISSIELFK